MILCIFLLKFDIIVKKKETKRSNIFLNVFSQMIIHHSSIKLESLLKYLFSNDKISQIDNVY